MTGVMIMLILIFLVLLNINFKIPPRDYTKEAMERDAKNRETDEE